MPLDVNQAEVVMEALESGPTQSRSAPKVSMSLAEREALKERLRPLVLEIMDEAFDRHRRSQGR
jgi:hypothetical protein